MPKRELLARAKARLDRLELYPDPVDLRGVRLVVAPWLFRIPGFRRFRGYATRHLVLLKGPALAEDLVVHELCHVWQLQFRRLRVWLSYARPSTVSRDRAATAPTARWRRAKPSSSLVAPRHIKWLCQRRSRAAERLARALL